MSNQPRGFFQNVIVSLTIPDLSQNVVEVDVIYDVQITGGQFSSFAFGVFDNRYGLINDLEEPDKASFTVTRDGDPENDFRINLDNQNPNIVNVELNLNPPITFSQSEIKFSFVAPLICNHPNGQQAIAAGFLSTITNVETRNAGADFTFPSGELQREAGEFKFTPNSQDTQVDENGQIQIFLGYLPSDIGFGTNFAKDVFLFLGEDVVDDAPNCFVQGGNNAFIIFVGAVFGLVCGCMILAGISQKFCDYSSPQPVRRDRELANLMNYPGTPDIILQPENGNGRTTVQAVLEDDDPDELNQVNPVTTIQVHMNRQSTVESADL